MSVIGTTGRKPRTSAPCGARVMMSTPNADHTGTALPGGGAGIDCWMTATRDHRGRRPERARQRAPLRAALPEDRRDQQRRERRVAGERVLRRDVEDRLRHPHRDRIGHERNQHDEDAAGGHLDGLAEPGFPSIKREHVFGKHRGQREDLRIARHHRRHDARTEDRRQPHRRVAVDQAENHVVAAGLRAKPVALGRSERRPGGRDLGPRLELGFDRRHFPGGVGREPQEHRRQPDRQHAQRIQDHRLPEVLEPASRQAEDADVRKGNRGERDERVAEKVQRRETLARQERRRRRRSGERLHRGAEPAHPGADDDDRDGPEDQEQHRLQGIDPRRAAHPAEEDVAHHDQRHDRAAQPERDDAAAHRGERRAAAHHRDDDVRHEQHRLHGEDHRADVAAFPPIAEHLHRRHEPMAAAERPQARADHQQADRNHQRRRRRHQAEGDDAVGERMARRAQDRERGHVGAEQRQQEHGRSERSAGEEVVLGVGAPARRAEREDADVQSNREIGEDDDGREHYSSPAGARWPGQIVLTSTQSRRAQPTVYAA